MNIIVGKRSGFCVGVKNAVNKTKECLHNSINCVVYGLGDIVHNEVVINELKTNGLVKKDSIDEVPSNSKVIIRAHGVSPEIYNKCLHNNIEIYDFTCPNVKRVHEIVKKCYNEKKYIVIIGDKKHPEIIGTKGYAKDNYMILEHVEDVALLFDDIVKTKCNTIAIVSQTTESVENFEKICEKIKLENNNKYVIEINKTICPSTSIRQAETEELSKKVDFMIIIGGKNSANTKKLYDISINNVNTLFISNILELNEYLSKYYNKIKEYNNIGIMAGASTPQQMVDEVVEKLCK